MRYADDFLVGIIGGKQDAEQLKQNLAVFLKEQLGLTLSDSKTKITHTTQKARFLGFDITITRSQALRKNAKGQLRRAFYGNVMLYVPKEKWANKLLELKAIRVKTDEKGKDHWRAAGRGDIFNRTDIEILSKYNAEVRGMYNYYRIADNVCVIGHFAGLMKHSKRDSRGFSKRTLSNIVELNVPLKDKIERYLFDNDIVEQVNGELRSKKRNGLIRFTDLEILTIYNAELRGICNYYCMASNFNALHYFAYLMEYSCLKTLAGKHKSKISKIKRKYRDGQGNWSIPYETRKGVKRMSFAKYQESKKMKAAQDKLPNAAVKAMHSVNSFDSRLKAHTCELCGKTDSRLYEVHHVKRLKDLNGKSIWERAMIARKRKTIVLCYECHHAIHDGKF